MLGNKKVLFVDSSGNMRFTMKTMLRSLGVEHIETLPPTTALLGRIEHQHYDFIIISHNESDKVTGIQLLEQARYQGILPETTAWILLVSDTSRDLIVHAIDNYPDDIVSKPFSAVDLKRRIDTLEARQTALSPIWNELKGENIREALSLCDHFEPSHHYFCAAQLLKARILMAHHRYFQAAKLLADIYRHFHRREAVIMQAYCLAQEHEYDEALQILGELICLNPSLLAAYDQAIHIEMARGDYFKARYLLQQSTSLSPHNPLRFQRLGYCAYLEENWDIAEPALGRAIRLGNGSVYESRLPYLQLAEIAAHRVEGGEQWQEFEKEVDTTLRRAARAFPDDQHLPVESALVKSRFYHSAKRHNEAKRYRDEANVLAHNQGMNLEAIHIWRRPAETKPRWLQNVPLDALRANIRPENELLERGCHAYERGQQGKAMECFAKVLRANPRHPQALLNAAQLYLEAVRDSSYQRPRRLELARQCLRGLAGVKLDAVQGHRRERLELLQATPLEQLPSGSLGELFYEGI